MIRTIQAPGLIISTAPRRTAAFEEFVTCLDWPVIISASPRRICDELLTNELQCLLFWLEDQRELSATVNLLTWLRQRSPRVYRIAIAYRIDARVEPMIRRAGVHMYLPATADVGAVVDEAVWPLLERAGLVPVAAEKARPPTRFAGAPPDWGELHHVNRPP
jgi:hypothetical protein